MNKMQNIDKNPTRKGISYDIAENGKSRSYKYGKLHPGCYNTPPLQADLVQRSRMAPERNRRGRAKTKLLFWQKSETKEPWEIERTKRENTREMNQVENNPLEKRNKEHYGNLVGWKTNKNGYDGQGVHASTPVETRCIRNDKDQLRQHSG